MHAYPAELADAVAAQMAERNAPPLALDVLRALLSASYQASLLREEERAITFRILLVDPSTLETADGGTPGLHVLRFVTPRGFSEDELRRLAPAAKLQRSLIGVRVVHGALQIWGIVHSGPGWLRAQQGGRMTDHAPPPGLVVTASAPGRLHVAHGAETMGTVVSGRLVDRHLDVFESQWLPASFRSVRGELHALHQAAREAGGAKWAPVSPDLPRMIAQHFVRRIISTIRVARHGGMVLFVPDALAQGPASEALRITFPFAGGEPRQRFRTLIVSAMNTLAAAHAGSTQPVGWVDYGRSTDKTVSAIDEGIFELSHMIAALSDVDGATVLTRGFEVLGFGAEIGGSLPHVPTVMRALDLEGDNLVGEHADGVGTRHRSAYRFCAAHPDALAVVVSHDGDVRFVRKKDDSVTYWEQGALGSEA